MNKETWEKYQATGTILSDEELLTMMKQVIEAKNLLDLIGGNYFDVVTFKLLHDWYCLKSMAEMRYLKQIPQWSDSNQKPEVQI